MKRYTLGESSGDLNTLFKQCLLQYDKTISSERFQFLPEYQEVIDWMLDTKGQGLFLRGDYGRGKTDVVYGVIRPIFLMRSRIIIQGCDAKFLYKELEALLKLPVIFIDDLGNEPLGSDYGKRYEPFNNLLDHAEQNFQPLLIISSNLDGQTFLNRYGDRSLDRIERLCRFIEFKGESLRG